MPRRANESFSDNDPPRKKSCNSTGTSSFVLKNGEYLKDITGKQWKLGKAVGVGGFGEIYLASDNLTKEVKTDCKYVAKVESHMNGPLFVEMNCYLRIAKFAMIEEWKNKKKLTSLGMPHYVASGSHVHKGEKYRFLILPKFDRDLEKVLEEKKMFNLKTVLTISLQIIDVLEYIHSKGYIHSDIKASNILLRNKMSPTEPAVARRVIKKYSPNRHYGNPMRTCQIKKRTRMARNLRPQAAIRYIDDIVGFEELIALADPSDTENYSNLDHENSSSTEDQVYLLDYGLACKFLTSSGEHKPFCVDERKAHAGTILFCSRDAHKGVPSRRSDLESLGYNIIYWLTGNLPWSGDINNPEIVNKKKQKAMTDVEYFLRYCFTEYPRFLEEYFKYLQKLEFQEKPNYDYCKHLLKESLKENGLKDDSCFDFDNMNISKPIKMKPKAYDNIKLRKYLHTFSRLPLQSNIPIKPLLRKKVKNKQTKKRNSWLEDLTDPEIILKQGRGDRKNTENGDATFSNIADLNIDILNPTYAMLEVYNKCRERIDSLPSFKGDSTKRKELEYEQMAVNLGNTKSGKVLKRSMSRRNKRYENQAKTPPQIRSAKSAPVVKKETLQSRKIKSVLLRTTYSLRG